MIKLYSQKEYDLARLKDLLPLQCIKCNKMFFVTKGQIKSKPNRGLFCTKNCFYLSRSKKIPQNCLQCHKKFLKCASQVKKCPNSFCSSNCSAVYNNSNKEYGIRRSKLEIWLEYKLRQKYPSLTIEFNNKTIIKSELDIFIPSLKLAFEINGIFHYKPIFGNKKFKQILNNDRKKIVDCLSKDIELRIINISKLDKFSEQRAVEYLNEIDSIIEDRGIILQKEIPYDQNKYFSFATFCHTV